jgi:Peptidase MA superfamily
VLSKTLLIGVLVLTFFPLPLLARQRNVIKAADVVVIYDEPLRGAAEVVADGYGSLRLELETILGWKVDFVPVVVLVQERSDFQQITGSSLVVAVAAPERDLIIIDYSRMNTHPFSLGTTLKHELCHLVLHHAIPGGNLPAWLDEGIAQWVSDGLTEILGDGRGSVLEAAVLANNQIALSRLTKGFPTDRESLPLAYEESKSLVDFMVREFGRPPLFSMLRYLREGDGVDTATMRGLGVSMAELESRWHDHLRTKSSWFPYLTSNLAEILLFLAALLTIAAFLRLIINKRRYRDEDLPGR